MKNIKLAALDLDDTLLDSQGQLSHYSRQVLQQAIARGITVVIASGRPYASLPEAVLSIPGIRYAVTSNGAAIHQVNTGERLCGFTLSREDVEKILTVTRGEPVLLETFIDGRAYADHRYVADPVRYGAGEKAVDYIHRTRQPVENIRTFIRENCGKLDSIDIICPQPEWKAVYRQRLEQLGAAVYLTTSCRQLLEISDQRAGKESALQYLCKLLDLQPQQCAAFGNAENDIGMLRFAGLGVAVANATPACLAAADVVCGDNDSDGPAKLLAELL